MRFTLVLAVVTVAAVGASLLIDRRAEGQLLLVDKNQRAVDVFNKWCLEADLDLAAIDRLATAANYEVQENRNIPLPNGQFFRQKNWFIPIGDGEAPILLSSNDVTNGPLHVLGCGIYGPELDGSKMEALLSNLERMGQPTKRPQGPQGSTVWWKAHVGSRPPSGDTEVMLARDVPQMPGVSVNLIYKVHRLEKATSP